MLANHGITPTTQQTNISQGKEILWPVTEINVTTLERLFFALSAGSWSDRRQLDAWELDKQWQKTFTITYLKRAVLPFQSPDAIPQDFWKKSDEFLPYERRDYGFYPLQNVAPLLFINHFLSTQLSSSLKERYQGFTNRLLTRYHLFLIVDASKLSYSYGSTRKCCFKDDTMEMFGIEEECSYRKICELLLSLSEKPDLFCKLLSLVEEEMNTLLDTSRRDRILNNHAYNQVTLPKITYSTILASLTRLLEKGYDLKVIELIVSSANRYLDLSLISRACALDEMVSILQKLPLANQQFTIKTLQMYIQKKVPKMALEECFEYRKERSTISTTVIAEIVQKLIKICHYVEDCPFQIRQYFVDEWFHPFLKKSEDPFTTNQLINAAFSDKLRCNSLEEFKTCIQEVSRETDLRVVSECVQQGSERDCKEAFFIESLQNSLDALIGFSKNNSVEKREEITFAIAIVGEKCPQLMLETSDQVGMPNIQTLLIDLSIPNFSQKKGVVGQMGNGLFQMYREAERVTVLTRVLEDNKVYLLVNTPYRDEGGNVIDIEQQCFDVTKSAPVDFQGTQIRMLLQNKEENVSVAMIEGLGLLDFFRDHIALTTVQLHDGSGPELVLNHTKQGEEEVLNAINPQWSFSSPTNKDLQFLKMTHDTAPGWVLTEGYPFKPLASFLKEHSLLPSELIEKYSYGWALNLPAGTYEPRQSRNEVVLTPEARNELKDLIRNWFYSRSFVPETHGPGTQSFPHFQSQNYSFNPIDPRHKQTISNTDLRKEIRPDDLFLENFFLHYQPPFLEKSFVSFMNDAFQDLVPQLQEQIDLFFTCKIASQDFQVKMRAIFNNWKGQLKTIPSGFKLDSNNLKLREAFLERIIEGWFFNKISFLLDSPFLLIIQPNPKTQLLKRENIKGDNVCLNLVRKMLAHYIEIMLGRKLSIRFSYGPVLGAAVMAYLPSQDALEVNLASIPLSRFLEIALLLSRRSPFTDDENIFLILEQNSGAINHEIEHARRKNDHNNCDVHAHGQDIHDCYVHFEACASSYARVEHQKGLFEDWAAFVDKNLTDLEKKDLEQQIKQFKNLEENDPEMLLKILEASDLKP